MGITIETDFTEKSSSTIDRNISYLFNLKEINLEGIITNHIQKIILEIVLSNAFFIIYNILGVLQHLIYHVNKNNLNRFWPNFSFS